MAYLYQRKNSRYWWIGFSKGSGRSPESTKLRWDDPAQSRVAHDLLAKAKSEERFEGSARMKFSQWVPRLIQERYANHAGNLKSYTNRWRALSAFLLERGIAEPAMLTAEDCWDYIDWRTSEPARGIRPACKNTALEELKFLRMIMRHAVALGFAARDPMALLRFEWEDQKEKLEIEDGHLPLIVESLNDCPHWMQDSFRIAYFTGCRLSETAIPMHRVSVAKLELDFRGKGNRAFVVPMPEPVVPLFAAMKARLKPGECAVNLPTTASIDWHHFFKKLALPTVEHFYCFHGLRVSFITRCIRAGLPEAAVMKLVNHSSVLISRLYQRHRATDLRRVAASIPHFLPAAGGNIGGGVSTSLPAAPQHASLAVSP